MIRYRLVCESGHDFESWFPSSESYDDQVARGFVACPACGSIHVSKGMMAPSIGRSDRAPASDRQVVPEASVPVPVPPAEAMLGERERQLRGLMRALREQVTKNADDVGAQFPEEARRMHYGESPTRAIYGEASLDEARALVDEGIDVAPLPRMPDDRN